MAKRTFEADREGRVTIYPTLYGSRNKGFVTAIIKKVVQRIFSFRLGK